MWQTPRCYKSTKCCYYWTQEVEVAGCFLHPSFSLSDPTQNCHSAFAEGYCLNKPESWRSSMKRNEADDISNFSDFSQCKAEFLRTAVPRQLCQSHLQSALSSYPPINRRHRATIMAWQYLHTLGFCCSHEGKKEKKECHGQMNVDSGHTKQFKKKLQFYPYCCCLCQYFQDGSYFRAGIDCV